MFWRLDVHGWGVDEVTYSQAGAAYVEGDFSPNRGHAWLAKELMGLSMSALGSNEVGVRLPGAVLGFATGFVLYALARRMAGPIAGLGAAAVWWLLPQAPGVHPIRLDRYGMLEPPMMFFAASALLAAWMWGETGRWRWVLAGGVLLGLSGSSKFTGAVFAPAVALPFFWVPLPIRTRIAQALAAVLAAIAGLVVPYLADGLEGIDALREGVALQFANNVAGHLQIVAGTLYSVPPWWSHWWWQAEYLSVPGVAALWSLAAVGLAAAGGRATLSSPQWRARAVLLAALAFPLLSLVVTDRKLPHYHLVLVPVLAVATGLALAAASGSRRSIFRVGAVLVALPLAAIAALNLYRVATLQPDAYRLAAQRLEAAGLGSGDIVVFGWPHVLEAEMPGAVVHSGPLADPPEAMVIDPITRDRFRGTGLDRYVSSIASGYERSQAGRLTVYVRSDL